MILDRFAKSLYDQNWFIVIIEVFVVVVGIIVGLQVDNWNEARKSRIDEQRFLVRLHQDVLLADELSSRVRDRRLGRLQSLIDAADVLFARAGRDLLTDEECYAIATSGFYNINVSAFPSLTELVDTGRLEILQNEELLTALVELQLRKEALSALITVLASQTAGAALPSRYPQLIQLAAQFDVAQGEVNSPATCDSTGMRTNQGFLNDFSISTDRYDAYLRDGLAPWVTQFVRVHELLDFALDIEHE